MRSGGFEEIQTAYAVDDPHHLVGQFRRFGPDGPAYEIMSVNAEGIVHVHGVYSEEEVVCRLDEVLADPLAETIP